ncbi:MAG: DUF4492 domain-containing protein [Dysgonamonadaceae bacterium]|jgi:hypothetical protein|nr:DUF4492 domain-containing protein [Dysgonamonadaceae bacterium]
MNRIHSAGDFFKMYIEGFRNLSWGKPLWIIILIKLFIMFAILKVFFFRNPLNEFDSEKERSQYIFEELIKNNNINEKI